MSHYRLNFIEGLGGPQLSPPPRRVRFGTTRDLCEARIDRRHRIYLVLLNKVGVAYAVQQDGTLRYGDDGADADLVARLWNDATQLVLSGRDLQ